MRHWHRPSHLDPAHPLYESLRADRVDHPLYHRCWT